MNGARAFVVSFEYEKRKDGSTKLKRIWVRFPDDKTGSLLREDNRMKGIICQENKMAVPISEIRAVFQIPRIKIKVRRTQFPMVLCYCMTSYKSQGQTLLASIIDFKEASAKHGHFYVGVTRVRTSQGLFIRNFSRSQIQCREDVKKELHILRRNKPYRFSKTYLQTKIWENANEVKIGYMNINGLYHNLSNFDCDRNLSNLSFICIAETKLTVSIETEKINSQLKNFEIIWRRDISTIKGDAHMGMLILQNKWENVPEIEITERTMSFTTKKAQYSKLRISEIITIIFLYINKTPNMLEIEEIADILKMENASVVMGDFNIDPNKEDGAKKINLFSKITKMVQVNQEVTRKSVTLDLIFRKKEMNELDFMPFSFCNMYSDHSAIGFRYTKDGIICDDFKEYQITNQDKIFLRKSTIDEESVTKQEKNNSKKIKGEKNEQNSSHQETEEDIIVMQCPRDISRLSNIRKLLMGEWVDSNIVNCYMHLINQTYTHVYTMDTQMNELLRSISFQQLDRRFRNINLFEYSLWLVPVNCRNSHWFLLAIDANAIDESKIEMKIYDSIGELETWKKVLEEEKLRDFVQEKYQQTFQLRECPLEISIHDMSQQIPQQENGIDCGVFTIMYAKYLAACQALTFKQDAMDKFRKKIYDEIKANKLEDIVWDYEDDFELPENFSDTEMDAEKRNELPEYVSDSGDEDIVMENEFDLPDIPTTSEKSKHETYKSKSNNTNTYRKRRGGQETQGNIQQYLKVYRFVNPPRENLCFSNAVVTVLLNIRSIQELLNENLPTLEQNPVYRVLRKLSKVQNNETSSTRPLRRRVQQQCILNNQNARNFDNNDQFDAAEFLGSLLEHMLIDHPDIVYDLFGQNKETIFCRNPQCNTDDHLPPNLINIVSLPFVGPTLHICLDEYLTEREIVRDCPHCDSQSASQITSFAVNPETIIFQILRYSYSEQIKGPIKNSDRIDIPIEMNLPGAAYMIVGCIFHYGQTCNSGHYTAAVYCKERKSFCLCNDETNHEIRSFDEELERTVYLIVYERQ